MKTTKSLRISTIALFVVLCLPQPSTGQFKLSSEIRPRLEINHGYRDLFGSDLDPGIIVTQRSRLLMEHSDDNVETKLSVQDVRTWGDEPLLSPADVAGVSLHEAWGQYSTSPFFSIKLGRQELVYDDHRLLGNVDWVQQGQSHDAVVLNYHKDDLTVHVGGAYNNDEFSLRRLPYTKGAYRALSYVWLNTKLNENAAISVIGIANGVENLENNSIYFTKTVGPHIVFKKGAVSGSATAYYQFGKTKDDIDVSAYLAAFSAQVARGNSSFGVGADYVSGTDALDTGNATLNSFNTLYATNHKFYGFMDYFLNIPAHTANGGLVDLLVMFNTRIGKQSSLSLQGHYFMLANNVIDPASPGNALDKGLGAEVDAVFNYSVRPGVTFQSGWSVLSPTESLDVIDVGTKGEFNTWIWTSLIFKPVFLNTSSN